MKKSNLQKNLGKKSILDSLEIIKKLFLISCVTIFINCSHNKGDTLYVNVNSLELLDKPFGIKKRTLEMNDSLTFIREMNGNWVKIAVEKDTFFFKTINYNPMVQETPFSKWKALIGQEVVFNHPDGYYELGSAMMKNGDILKVRGYSEHNKKIKFRPEGGLEKEIPVEWVKIDWKKILKKYPKLKEK
jgi:hypothetical protein